MDVSGSTMQERETSIVESGQPEADVTLGADGILVIDLRNCDRVTLPLIETAHARHLALSPGRKVPVLLRGHHVGSIDYAAQRFGSSSSVNQVVAAMGLVVKSFLERHLARLFLMYHRPSYPARVFEDEAMARNWLSGYID